MVELQTSYNRLKTQRVSEVRKQSKKVTEKVEKEVH